MSERFDGDFPHFVWYQAPDGQRYQARLTNRGSGAYKGWPITADEVDESIFQP